MQHTEDTLVHTTEKEQESMLVANLPPYPHPGRLMEHFVKGADPPSSLSGGDSLPERTKQKACIECACGENPTAHSRSKNRAQAGKKVRLFIPYLVHFLPNQYSKRNTVMFFQSLYLAHIIIGMNKNLYTP